MKRPALGFQDPEAYDRVRWATYDTLDPVARLAAQPALFRAFATPGAKAYAARNREAYLSRRRTPKSVISEIRSRAARQSVAAQRERRAS